MNIKEAIYKFDEIDIQDSNQFRLILKFLIQKCNVTTDHVKTLSWKSKNVNNTIKLCDFVETTQNTEDQTKNIGKEWVIVYVKNDFAVDILRFIKLNNINSKMYNRYNLIYMEFKDGKFIEYSNVQKTV